jgi:hypothetical protein
MWGQSLRGLFFKMTSWLGALFPFNMLPLFIFECMSLAVAEKSPLECVFIKYYQCKRSRDQMTQRQSLFHLRACKIYAGLLAPQTTKAYNGHLIHDIYNPQI